MSKARDLPCLLAFAADMAKSNHLGGSHGVGGGVGENGLGAGVGAGIWATGNITGDEGFMNAVQDMAFDEQLQVVNTSLSLEHDTLKPLHKNSPRQPFVTVIVVRSLALVPAVQ